MDFVLGVSMAPTTVRLVLIEGENADGVTVEQDNFEVAAAGDQAAPGAAVDQVIAAIVGTREGAVAGGYQLNSTGVTWTDPAGVGALRDELTVRDVGSVMLVSPLLAAAALAQTVGSSIGHERTAMLFVEPENATLAVVEVADGSIVELHRQPLGAGQGTARRAVQGAIAAQLATMVAGLDARESRADGVFLIGCGTDIVSTKPALEAVTSLEVSVPEEPDMALARGAALASANAPLFASSTAALAYALDPGTGEMNPRAFSPTYLDVSAHPDVDQGVLAYSALEDSADDEHAASRRWPSAMLAGSALAAIFAVVAGVLVFSLTADRSKAALWHNPRASVATPAQVPAQAPAQVPAQAPSPPPAQLPAPSAAPPAPPPEVAAPPPTTANAAPVRPAAPVRRAPAPRAPASVPTPVPQAAPSPVAPQPAAPPPSAPAVVAAPPPQPAPAAVPARPPMTMYLHFPFVTVPIPITPPPPPQPPPPPGP